ncbi:mucin-17 [Biomphalaria glabrata]
MASFKLFPLVWVLTSSLGVSEGLYDIKDEMQRLKNVVSSLARQVMLQQFSQEEKLRSDGGSGIKQVRVDKDGEKNYDTNSHSGVAMGAIHDHSNYKMTVGLGEGQYVLNGVEFRTRHNDYQLRMPSTRSSDYHIMSEIQAPAVPPQVLEKSTLEEQILEMREWFKAWRDQNYSVRDYRKYFKPVLCYLEGAWTKNTESIEEPFFSDRHSLDATSWFDLQEKVRYSAYTGRKNLLENFAFLPTTIINITASGVPVYAQWNYRMLCHPLSKNLPTSYLKPVDDLSVRLPRGHSFETYSATRGARFTVVSPEDSPDWNYLDTMMGEVPGKDNYGAQIYDTALNTTLLSAIPEDENKLNVGYYSRRYRVEKADAMGLSFGRRGFSDPNVFMAETTHKNIADIYLRQCYPNKVCLESNKRMSYAIPLEVIYLTPLSSWNPYDIPLHRDEDIDRVLSNGFNGKRIGGFLPHSAFNGSLSSQYYRTPADFFSGVELRRNPADTMKKSVGVLDRHNTIRNMTASGIRVFLPNITGVGVLRTRFPITPVHAESSPVWKELNALKDFVMKNLEDRKMNQRQPRPPKVRPQGARATTQKSRVRPGKTTTASTPVYPIRQPLILMTSIATRYPPGEHYHTIEMNKHQQARLQKGEVVHFRTSQDNGHSHTVKVQFFNGRYHVIKCDSKTPPCWDGHTKCLTTEEEAGCPLEDF